MWLRFFILLGILLVGLLGCASNARYDSDRFSRSYYQGGSRVFFPNFGHTLKSVIEPAGPNGIGTASTSLPVREKSTLNEEEAAFGVLATGLSLLINQDYYKSSYLSGRCSCRSEQREGSASMEVPCSNVLVALYDEKGKELSRILTEDGEFVFPTEKDRRYRLGVVSPRYQLVNTMTPSLIRGDNVVLRLISRPRKSPAE